MILPWLMMQKHILQPNKKMKKDLFIYLNASKARKEKYRQAKTKKNNSGLIVDRKESGQKSHTSNFLQNNDSHTCLKTLKILLLL
jgi:hypothetical protein